MTGAAPRARGAGKQSPLRSARVRVPGSASNLGSGFDCVGLALDRYLDAEFVPAAESLRLERHGSLAQLDLPTHEDLLVRAFRAAIARAGEQEPHGIIEVKSEIPLSRGLGSSAAAIVAGLGLATGALDATFDRSQALEDGLQLEPHPDNLAPALFGGLVASVPKPGQTGFRTTRLALSPLVGFAVAAPATEVSTAAARAALPASVPHGTAVRSAARAIALVRGLESADAELIRIGFEDESHVPYRWPMIPLAAEARGAALEAGAWAVTISGAGSALIAASEPAKAAIVAAAMRDVFAGAGPGAFGFHASPDMAGAVLGEPVPSPMAGHGTHEEMSTGSNNQARTHRAD